MKTSLTVIFSFLSYLVGLLGLSAFMLYMGAWSFLPIHINSGIPQEGTAQAICINLSILVLFGLHHSIAARSSFKAWLARLMPMAAERSFYVLISGLFMLVFCLHWQSIPGVLWKVTFEPLIWLLTAIHILGWLVVVLATFEIDHFHLMGIKQGLNIHTEDDKVLKERFLYKIVRHPIQTGVLMGIWSTAYMSMTQFMLSVGFTLYIVIGLYFEEKSLEAHFGEAYLDYKKRVPGLIPFVKLG